MEEKGILHQVDLQVNKRETHVLMGANGAGKSTLGYALMRVPGITLGNFIRTSLEQKTGKHIKLWNFNKELKRSMEILQMAPSYADRVFNVGFSIRRCSD